VKAGYKNIGRSRQIFDELGPYRDNLTKTGANGKIIFGFTVRFTAITADTAPDILVYIIFAHS